MGRSIQSQAEAFLYTSEGEVVINHLGAPNAQSIEVHAVPSKAATVFQYRHANGIVQSVEIPDEKITCSLVDHSVSDTLSPTAQLPSLFEHGQRVQTSLGEGKILKVTRNRVLVQTERGVLTLHRQEILEGALKVLE